MNEEVFLYRIWSAVSVSIVEVHDFDNVLPLLPGGKGQGEQCCGGGAVGEGGGGRIADSPE